MSNKSQIQTLFLIIFFIVMGTAMPYVIFAPLFINNGGVFSQTVSSTVALNFTLGITLAAYPFGPGQTHETSVASKI